MESFRKLPTWAQVSLLSAGGYAIKQLYNKLSEKSVEGEVVLITGAGSGIGRLMALKFAKLKARLVLWDVALEAAEGVANEIVRAGGEAKAYKVDVTDLRVVNEAAAAVKHEFGRVDILVNNAGIVSGRSMLENTPDRIRKTFEVNTLALCWTVKAFLPDMIARNHGHIVTTASASAFVGVSGLADYAASKWAALGFAESIRMELRKMGKSGVKTTVACPYYINTGMFDGVQTRFSFFLPILEPDYVANTMVTAVLRDQAMVVMPSAVWLVVLARALLPPTVFDAVVDLCGINSSMDHFQGRPVAPPAAITAPAPDVEESKQ